ncbi:MAG: hypothetical protein WAN65_12745, partial [Candidatus Sulfotelmatobacter sp.]
MNAKRLQQRTTQSELARCAEVAQPSESPNISPRLEESDCGFSQDETQPLAARSFNPPTSNESETGRDSRQKSEKESSSTHTRSQATDSTSTASSRTAQQPGRDSLATSGAIVEFDPSTHTYYLDGERVPSVTQILAESGLVDAGWYTEWSRERGSFVHELSVLLDSQNVSQDTGELWAAVIEKLGEIELSYGSDASEEVSAYFNGYRNFRRDHPEFCDFGGIEELVFSPTLKVAGRLDRRYLREDGNFGIFDIKTAAGGAPPSWVKYQMAFYGYLFHPKTIFHRLSITLSPKLQRGYRIDEYPMSDYLADVNVCKAAAIIVHAK